MMTKSVLHAADKLLLESGIISLPPTLQKLRDIAKGKGWILSNYKSGNNLINALCLSEYIKDTPAFTLKHKNKNIILYDEKLSYQEKIHCICHEMGHIVLDHTEDDYIVGYSRDKAIQSEQEREAEAFAAEMCAPACVLSKIGIKTYEDLVNERLINEQQAIEHIKNISSSLPSDDIEIALCKRFVPQKPKIRVKEYLLIYAAMIVIFAIAILVVKGVIDSNRKPLLETPILGTETVYITSSGERYHRENCYYVEGKNNVFTLSIEEAERAGYTPCAFCY
ncbi:MAG: ImmA/IrrE family metallo-endopeptidase [Eubacterium sp.]|nr:ImmA/IrrE family metallo-endopeptidase [Eubacterium sp.]